MDSMNNEQNKLQNNKQMSEQNIEQIISFSVVSFFLLVIIFIFQNFSHGIFLYPRNISNILRQSATIGIPVLGMILIFKSGEIDLSIGSVIGFVSMIIAILLSKIFTNVTVVILISLLVGFLIGFIQGVIVGLLRVPGFIITFVSMISLRLALLKIADYKTVIVNNKTLLIIGQGYLSKNILFITIGIIIALIIGVIIFCVLMYENIYKNKNESTSFQYSIIKSGVIAGIITFVLLLIFLFLNFYRGIPISFLIMIGLFLLVWVYTKVRSLDFSCKQKDISENHITIKKIEVFSIMGLLGAVTGIILTGFISAGTISGGANTLYEVILACLIAGIFFNKLNINIINIILSIYIIGCFNNGMAILNISFIWSKIFINYILLIAVIVTMILLIINKYNKNYLLTIMIAAALAIHNIVTILFVQLKIRVSNNISWIIFGLLIGVAALIYYTIINKKSA